MSRFFNKKYEELKPCIPAVVESHKKQIVLDTGQSPYPASSFVYRSIDQFEVDNLRLYSGPEAGKLVKAIAENFGVEENQIIVGNGADEILTFAFMAFQRDGGKFFFPNISYSFYSTHAEVAHAQKEEIPVRGDLSINIEDYLSVNGTIVIANPNTPTGIALTATELERIVSANRDNLVIVDEAYVDFGAESCVPLIPKYDNLLVVQTFSKSRNLAGARVGFALGNAEVIEDLNKIKFSFNRYNMNRLSIIAATAAMKDGDYFKKCTNDIKRIRDRFAKEMTELGFIVIDSKANFVMVRSPQLRGQEYATALAERNIIVKHYENPIISDYVRISIGVNDAMDAVIKATKSILGIEEQKG